MELCIDLFRTKCDRKELNSIFRAHVGALDKVHKAGYSLFFMKLKKMAKMVASCSYHETPCPPGASPPLSSHGQHG